jgi:hypothetical protein
MQQGDSTEEQFTDRMSYAEVLGSCRSHIESLQNLSYLTSLDADDRTQVRLSLDYACGTRSTCQPLFDRV